MPPHSCSYSPMDYYEGENRKSQGCQVFSLSLSFFFYQSTRPFRLFSAAYILSRLPACAIPVTCSRFVCISFKAAFASLILFIQETKYFQCIINSSVCLHVYISYTCNVGASSSRLRWLRNRKNDCESRTILSKSWRFNGRGLLLASSLCK